MKNFSIVLSVLFVSITHSVFAQSTAKTDTTSNYSKFKRSVTLGGLVQARYVYSLTPNVDVDGKNFPANEKGVTNSFQLKRIRVQIKGQINDKFDMNILANFADFSGNPQNKVLENAYIRYQGNSHFNVMAGQFRPFFGLEDEIAADFVKSLDYSNQYNAFSSSGWQSFQLGLTVYGNITGKDAKLPLRYYAGVYNGNNKNQTDNDNNKNAYARVEGDVIKNTTIGFNAAIGSSHNNNAPAWGGDFKTKFSLGNKWSMDISGEYKEGANFATYNKFKDNALPNLDSMRMRGAYILPNLRYDLNQPRLRSVEFSSRYEYFDDTYKLSTHNPRQTITPMLSFEFADDYFARLVVGTVIDLYKQNVPNTTYYSHNTFIAQFQVRF